MDKVASKNRVRAKRVAAEAVKLIALNSSIGPIDHLIVLVRCGHGKRAHVECTYPSIWHDDDVYTMLWESLSKRELWHDKEHTNEIPYTDLCNRVGQLIMGRVMQLYERDHGLEHTAVLTFHPEGATQLACVSTDNGRRVRDALIEYVRQAARSR